MAEFAPLVPKPKAVHSTPRAKAPAQRRMRSTRSAAADGVELIQTALEVSEPGDELEQEADSVADQVMRMTEPNPVGNAASGAGARVDRAAEEDRVQRACAECGERMKDEEDEPAARGMSAAKLQRTPVFRSQAPAPKSKPFAPIKFQQSLRAQRGGGEPLPGAVRRFMEPRFNQDFSGVRVHRDARASELAKTVEAKAFTVGRDLFFKEGQFQPGTERGQRLLAHELTHVVQQQRGESGLQRQIDPSGAGPNLILREEEAPRRDVGRVRVRNPLLPGNVTSVKSKHGVRLGKDSDLSVIAGTIPNGARVQVLDVAEGGNKVKIGPLSDEKVGEPQGWTLRSFLGEKEEPKKEAAAGPALSMPASELRDPNYIERRAVHADIPLPGGPYRLDLTDKRGGPSISLERKDVHLWVDPFFGRSELFIGPDVYDSEAEARQAADRFKDVPDATAFALYRGPQGVVLPTILSETTAPHLIHILRLLQQQEIAGAQATSDLAVELLLLRGGSKALGGMRGLRVSEKTAKTARKLVPNAALVSGATSAGANVVTQVIEHGFDFKQWNMPSIAVDFLFGTISYSIALKVIKAFPVFGKGAAALAAGERWFNAVKQASILGLYTTLIGALRAESGNTDTEQTIVNQHAEGIFTSAKGFAIQAYLATAHGLQHFPKGLGDPRIALLSGILSFVFKVASRSAMDVAPRQESPPKP